MHACWERWARRGSGSKCCRAYSWLGGNDLMRQQQYQLAAVPAGALRYCAVSFASRQQC
jgi:hypothetical protein